MATAEPYNVMALVAFPALQTKASHVIAMYAANAVEPYNAIQRVPVQHLHLPHALRARHSALETDIKYAVEAANGKTEEQIQTEIQKITNAAIFYVTTRLEFMILQGRQPI